MSRENVLVLGSEVLRLVARGLTNQEIAAELHLSDAAVKGRLRKLYGLIGARSAAHAVVIAGMDRLLSAEDLRAAAQTRRPGWQAEDDDEDEETPGRSRARKRQQKEAGEA